MISRSIHVAANAIISQACVLTGEAGESGGSEQQSQCSVIKNIGGRLHSLGLQRIGQDWVINTHTGGPSLVAEMAGAQVGHWASLVRGSCQPRY